MTDNETASESSGASSDAYVPFDEAEQADPQWQHNPAFHAFTLPGSFPPDLGKDDRQFLAEARGWYRAPVDDDAAGGRDPPNHAPQLFYHPSDPAWAMTSWYPYWTQPGFDLRRQEQIGPDAGLLFRYRDDDDDDDDGAGARLLRRGSGRPAVLPADQARNPTDYAVRFGIHPRAPPSSTGQARSRVTPTDHARYATWQTADEKDADDGVQMFHQRGYTSSELAAIGAYDPHMNIVVPDLNNELHSFVQRSRWTQKPWPFEKGNFWGGNYKIHYHLDTHSGRYDVNVSINVQEPIPNVVLVFKTDSLKSSPLADNIALWQDTRVWQAIQPSLRLVTLILQSRLPIYELLGNFYHLRRVAPERDRHDGPGLQRYGHHKALHFDVDPASMYPTAKLLMTQYPAFDPKQAADAMLERNYVLSFINHPSDGFTRSMDESGYWEVRTCLSVQFVWPLLEPKFSDADRAPYHFFIANVLLHELAHAYHCAIDMMLTDPDQLRRTPYGQTLPHDIFPLLQQLGNEMLPPYQENEFTLQGLKWNGLFRGSDLTSEQWFFEDECKGEEGMATENQIWGGTLSSCPSIIQGGGSLRPFHSPAILSTSWPDAHPQPHAQARDTNDAYTRYLPSPAANTWTTHVAIPTATYAAYFRESFWASTVRRFSTLALRLQPTDAHGTPLRATLAVADQTMTAEIIRAFRAPQTARWMVHTAYAQLRDAGCDVLASYLLAATFELVSARVLGRRLYYERRTWDRRFAAAHDVVADAVDAVDTWTHELADVLAPTTARLAEDAVHDTIEDLVWLVADMAGTLLHVIQYLGQDAMYSQALVGLYLQQPPRHRPQIYRRYLRGLIARLRHVSAVTTTLLARLDAALLQNEQDGSDPQHVECVLQHKIMAHLVDPASPAVEGWDRLWQRLADDLDSLRQTGHKVATLCAAVDDVVTRVVQQADQDTHERRGAPAPSSPRRSRPRYEHNQTTRARARARQPTRMLRAAALRQLRELDGRGRAAISVPGQGQSPSRPTADAPFAAKLDRIALTLARRWFHILNAHPDLKADGLQEQQAGIARAMRWFDTADQTQDRRADLMAEARSLVENDRKERMDRQMFWRNMPPTSTEQGSSSVLRPPHELPGGPSLAELREAIKRLAGTNQEDAAFLGQQWTEEKIQAVIDGDEEEFGGILGGMGF